MIDDSVPVAANGISWFSSITTRMLFGFSILSVSFLVLVGLSTYHIERSNVTTQIVEQLSQNTRLKQQQFQQEINSATQNLLFMASSPEVSSLFQTGAMTQQSQSLVKSLFKGVIDSSSRYTQIRLIDAGDAGKELIRINRSVQQQTDIVADIELQSKAGEPYFQKTLSLQANEVYLSYITYNREHGQIIEPRQPMLRVATPIFVRDQRIAILVINIDVASMIKQLRSSVPSGGDLYFSDALGRFIIHPSERESMGFEDGSRLRLNDVDGMSVMHFLDHPSSQEIDINEHTILVHDVIEFADTSPGSHFHVVMQFKRDTLLSNIWAIGLNSLIYLLPLIAIGLAATFILARCITTPLKSLCRVMNQYDFDPAVPVPSFLTRKKDEIGLLSNTFKQLITRVEKDSLRLSESEKLFRLLMETASDGILLLDSAGFVLQHNKAALQLLSLKEEEVYGQTVSQFLALLSPAGTSTSPVRWLVKARQKGKEARFVIDICMGNSAKRSVAFSLSSFVHGSEQRYAIIMHDATVQKRSHARLESQVQQRTQELSEINNHLHAKVTALQAAKDKLRLSSRVFNDVGEAIVITDSNNQIVDVNQAYCDITGYSKADVVGKDPKILRSYRHSAEFYEEMWCSIRKNSYWRGEIWDRRKDGSVYPKLLAITAVRDSKDEIEHYIGTFSNISELKKTEDQLIKLAFYDPLTDLPNRALYQRRLDREINAAQQQAQKFALLIIDLDHFKDVNETLGHHAGDQLLEKVAERLKSSIEGAHRTEHHLPPDFSSLATIARLGGDEFAVILPDMKELRSITSVADKIQKELNKPVKIDGRELEVGASIGIAIYPDNGKDEATLAKNCDAAMYKAKEYGRGQFQFFSQEFHEESMRRMELESQLRYGIRSDNEQFSLVYQPKMDLKTGRVTGAEALLRWQLDGVMISPEEFIPIAEKSGLILPLGGWVIEQACIQAKRWTQQLHADFKMAINLSPMQFRDMSLLSRLTEVLEQTGLSPGNIELEITESSVIKNLDEAVFTLQKIRNLGVTLAMDDFGTGYSSLSYLKSLPIHTLKIDRSFIRDLQRGGEDAAIVQAIISMAKALGLSVVAEGVETKQQLRFLEESECDEIQGYFLSPPVRPDEFETTVEQYLSN